MSLNQAGESSSPLSSPRPEKRARIVAEPEQEQDQVESKGSATAPRTARNPRNRKSKPRRPTIEPYSADDVLQHDVAALLQREGRAVAAGKEWDAPLTFGTEVELVVSELSSNGDSLSLLPPPHPPWVIAVPFALPGERIRARVHRSGKMMSFADLLSVAAPNAALRDMARVQCRYFGKCSGCQYQMMAYEDQLEVKRGVVDKAYRTFSGLPLDRVPSALPTMGSPRQYGYRTKITPHFDVPPKKLSPDRRWELRIGFHEKGRRAVMDIEECPIATPVLNAALGPARKKVQENIHTYQRGATLLLRDSLVIDDNLPSSNPVSSEQHVCVTDHAAPVRERVGPLLFEYAANSFFQNNNAILLPLTSYVRAALPQSTTHLVDAYCGAGLFAVSLAPHVAHVAGVEISADSVRAARHNAALNGVHAAWHIGDAGAIFAAVGDIPPESTAVVLDPPRKGCDAAFVAQLLAWGPATVVYVSCNVHTQARDVGVLVREGRYVLESVRGFDLFPQTAHVESVAVLRRSVDGVEGS